MASTGLGFYLTKPEPDFEEALIALTLASCLLADKQRKLAGEMLGRAMNLMEPVDFLEVMRGIYRSHNESIMATVGLYTESNPVVGDTNGN